MIRKFSLLNFLLISGLLFLAPSYAKGVYQQPVDFINDAFKSQVPEPDIIWIKGEIRQQIEKILQHKYQAKRLRYWKKQQRSVWILEEI